MTRSDSEPADVRPRRRSTAVRPSDDTLLDGVLSVFAAHGFDNVTMEQLATAAETSKPTLYAHFGTKDQLFDACVRREAMSLLEWMRESYRRAQGFDLDRHVATTTRALFDFAATHPEGFHVLFGAPTAGRSHELRTATIQSVADTVAELIRHEYGGADLEWGASADFCAAAVADIGVRGVQQAITQRLDFTAAANLTISLIVAAMRHLDPATVRAVDLGARPAGPAEPPLSGAPTASDRAPLSGDRAQPAVPLSPVAPRSDVLDTAIGIFLRGERLELHAVATELGISRTTIYRRFGTREELLGAAIARQFEHMITAIDSRCTSRGAHRISEVFDRALRRLAADPALRTYLQNEAPAALRLVTQADGPVHRGSVALVERLIQRAQLHDGYRPPIDRTTLAFALVRLGESFLYSNAVADTEGDIDHLLRVQTALLGVAAPVGGS
ncbi:QsdR family transcriptional regulator [Nocardia sp. NPDC058633]|uniref:QsdR family transcriptional regulator n=1 Tax=Nocardia sp. NPDC058633 TaxID=3346568 RepID=UPI00364EFADA